jgi:hypothetical protein
MKYLVEFKDGRPSVVIEAETDEEAHEKAWRLAWGEDELDENDFWTHPAYLDEHDVSVHAMIEGE